MTIDFSLINGLVFGIAHSDAVYVEDDETEEIYEASAIIVAIGFIQIAFLFN